MYIKTQRSQLRPTLADTCSLCISLQRRSFYLSARINLKIALNRTMITAGYKESEGGGKSDSGAEGIRAILVQAWCVPFEVTFDILIDLLYI